MPTGRDHQVSRKSLAELSEPMEFQIIVVQRRRQIEMRRIDNPEIRPRLDQQRTIRRWARQCENSINFRVFKTRAIVAKPRQVSRSRGNPLKETLAVWRRLDLLDLGQEHKVIRLIQKRL